MKLLLVSQNFSPELTGIGKYSGEMAQAWVDRGHEVFVVCAPEHYPAWRLADADRGLAWRVQRPRPGLTVLRCPLWVPATPSALRRLLYQASFALTSLPALLTLALRHRPDVVMAVVPATFVAPGTWLAARLVGARAWLHVQDLELDAAFGLGFFRSAWLRTGLLALERQMLRRFDHVSTISRRMMRALACKGVDLGRSSLVPNWVDLEALAPDEAGAAAMRSRLGIGARQVVMLFSGTMNRKQGLGVVVETARRLQDRADIVFVLCGQGEMRPVLEREAAGLPNLRFLDLQPAALLPALLTMADVHLLPQLRGAADLVMPSKLGGMLASGRVVLAAAEADSEIAATIRPCGLCVEPESADAFTAAVLRLADDTALRLSLGTQSRRVAEAGLGARAVLDRLDSALRAEAGLSAGPG